MKKNKVKAAFVSAYNRLVAAISAKEAQSERLANFIKVLKAQDGIISEFDGSLWGSMVEFITVGRGKEIVVTFRDGHGVAGITDTQAGTALGDGRVSFFVEGVEMFMFCWYNK